MSGAVVPGNARTKIDRVCDSAGSQHWPLNGLRHSFASYRLAATNDAATVAAELGNTSTKMLYSTYREVVQPEEAARYWKIGPSATDNVISFAAK